MQTKTIIDLIVAKKNADYTMVYFASERHAETKVIVNYDAVCMRTSEVKRLEIVVGDLMAV
jgi:hypothetical protein